MVGLACWDSATTRLVVGRGELVLPARGLVRRPVERVVVNELESVTVRRDRDKEEVDLRRKDGHVVRVPLGDLMRAAMPEMEEVLMERGVVVGR
jgi:hypothetical protein